MRIVEVEYSRLISEPLEFGNKKIGAKATVGDNDLPTMILVELKEWVDKQLQIKVELSWQDKLKITKEVLQTKLGIDDLPF